MDNSRFPKQCYLMLLELHRNGRKTWAGSIENLLYKHGFGYVWIEQQVGDVNVFMNQFTQRLIDCACQDWHDQLHNMPVARTYVTFKSELTVEKYLISDIAVIQRISMAKLRCSSHKLKIQLGRQDDVPIADRLCLFCKSHNINVVEDEYHFMVTCPCFHDLRSKYIPHKFHLYPTYNKFIRLMSSQDNYLLSNLAKFVFLALKLRASHV